MGVRCQSHLQTHQALILKTAIPESGVRNVNIRAAFLTLMKGKQIYYYFFSKCFCWLRDPLALQRQVKIWFHPAVPIHWEQGGGGKPGLAGLRWSRRPGNDRLGSKPHQSLLGTFPAPRSAFSPRL